MTIYSVKTQKNHEIVRASSSDSPHRKSFREDSEPVINEIVKLKPKKKRKKRQRTMVLERNF